MNRAACVVGASGGIGKAIVARLERDGWSPVLCMSLGDGIDIDVRDQGSVRTAFAAGRNRSPELGLLVIATGIVDQTSTDRLSLERWNEVLAINLTGPFLCCREGVDWLADGARIVLLGSLSAKTGGGLTGAAYAVSKGGVATLSKALARELAPRRITVNCVEPGGVETPMLATNDPAALRAMVDATPLRRSAMPEEIAGAVAFLASRDAAFITGTSVAVNGGLRMD
ncbi:MAG: SDR family NAD(P)-dependent oxidoreductase [Rhizobiaceae bacterium]